MALHIGLESSVSTMPVALVITVLLDLAIPRTLLRSRSSIALTIIAPPSSVLTHLTANATDALLSTWGSTALTVASHPSN